MKKWLWTFGLNTMYAKRYVMVHTDKGDGRDLLFQIYGRDNIAMSYLLDCEPYKEDKLREDDYKKMADWYIKEDVLFIKLYSSNKKESLLTYKVEVTDELKHQIWDKMIGGI